jgi:hypothetical protein
MKKKLLAVLALLCLFAAVSRLGSARAAAESDKLPLTITANDAYKAGCTLLTFTGTEFTTTALQPGDSVTSVTLTSAGASESAAVGIYPIVPSNAQGVGLDHYDIIYEEGHLTVTDGCGWGVLPSITEGASVSVSMSVNGSPNPFSLALHATDGYGDILTWSISSPASHGTASIGSTSSCTAPAYEMCSAATVSYTPAYSYIGADSFTVQVVDASYGRATVDVHVTLAPETLTAVSSSLQDGWIRESGEFTAVGGARNASRPIFKLGDDNFNRQLRAILSFDTRLPSGVVITRITLKIRRAGQQGMPDPFHCLGAIQADFRRGNFGLPTLQLVDFQSPPTLRSAIIIRSSSLADGWYAGSRTAPLNSLVNASGNTQVRLRFTRDDDDNRMSNLLMFYSGNAVDAANRPALVVEYYLP